MCRDFEVSLNALVYLDGTYTVHYGCFAFVFGNSGPNPDCKWKSFVIKTYFFLPWQSDQRKLLPGLEKGFYNKDCNGKRDTSFFCELAKQIALEKN